jgi:hypothetical protein
MKPPKKIFKTGSNGEEYLVDNPNYSKRGKPTNVKPKNKNKKK